MNKIYIVDRFPSDNSLGCQIDKIFRTYKDAYNYISPWVDEYFNSDNDSTSKEEIEEYKHGYIRSFDVVDSFIPKGE